MSYFNTSIVLIIFTIIVGIIQCSDDCSYHADQPGKKCFNEDHDKYICCSANDQCQNGRCSSLDTNSPSNGLPLHISILIGVGGCVFVLLCIVVIGAIYWHREEINLKKKLANPFALFSQRKDRLEHTDNTNENDHRMSTSTEPIVNLKIPYTMRP